MENKRDVVLMQERISLAEQVRHDFVVTAEEGTKISDVLEPSYWAHVANSFEPFDHVEVRQETGEWTVDLMVIDRGRNWARMFERQRYELVPPSEMPPVPAQYKVEWKGPHHKFCAIRVQDKSTVQEGFPDRAAADAWVKNFETVTA